MHGEELRVLAEEQAALRRVATLVAQGASPEDLFTAVTEEVGQRLPVDHAGLARYEPDGSMTVVASWGSTVDQFPVGSRWSPERKNLGMIVFETGRPTRIDSFAGASGQIAVAVREAGVRSGVAAPIIVEGRLWGVMAAGSTLDRPLPADTEARLADFTELLATAIANAESRVGLARLAGEQAALRRVATLVARGTPQEQLFAAVTEEVGRLLPVDFAIMRRYGPDGTATPVAVRGIGADRFSLGSRWTLEGTNLATTVFETGRPGRIDNYADASGPIGLAVREAGIRSAVGTPILVEGRVWGVVIAGSILQQRLPADTEARLASFTELLATAIANSESRAGLARLAEEQAALRRVATLVAQATPPEEVFAAVTEEVGTLLGADLAGMVRLETDATLTLVATWAAAGENLDVGTRWPLDESDLATTVWRTGRPARRDSYDKTPGRSAVIHKELGIRSSVASPIVVEGRSWGGLVVHSKQTEPLPADTEARLGSFAELAATAVANAESRAGLARLAAEQAALRRVATLVAGGTPSEDVFTAVVEEVGKLLPVEYAGMIRYESDGTATAVAAWGTAGEIIPTGSRTGVGGKNLGTIVAQSGRPARIDGNADASGPLGVAARKSGIRSAVGAPIIVEGRLWGMIAAGSSSEQPLPPNTEARLANFTELLATAIGNAESRADLAASRARIVAAADETRKRIERDLHDRAQQRLVSLGLELHALRAAVPPELGELERELSRAAEGLASVFEELREISRGIHPAILSEKGLQPALRALARRSAMPVELDLRAKRHLPEHVQVASYYVVSEALTNAAKHAHASVLNIELEAADAIVRLAIRDNGIGGADPAHGSGLVGLSDRIAALGGRLQVTSPPGEGTTLLIEIPLEVQSGAESPEP